MGLVRAAWLGVVAGAVACGTLLEVGDDTPATADSGTSEAGTVAESGTSSGSTPTCSAEVPTSIDFGEVFVGSSTSRPLVIKNLGDTETSWETSVPPPAFSVNPTSFTIPPQGSANATVTFAPGGAASSQGALTLTTAGGCKFDVQLRGSGVAPNSFAVSPLTVDLVGPCNGPASPGTLTIAAGNTGTTWGITQLSGIALTATPDGGIVAASSSTSTQIATTQTMPAGPGQALTGELSLKLGEEATARKIPVKATAQGAYISFSPNVLVLIPFVGGSLKVENTGNASATITLAANAPFKFTPSTLTLAAKSSANVAVTTVNQSGAANSSVTVTANPADALCGYGSANLTAPPPL